MVSEGLLARNAALRSRVLATGQLQPIDQGHFFAILDQSCSPENHASSRSDCQLIVGIKTPANLRAKGLKEDEWIRTSLFRDLWRFEASKSAQEHSLEIESSGAQRDLKKLFATSASISKNLTITPSQVDPAKPMHTCGVDSLLAVELRSWIRRTFQADVPVFEISAGSNFAALGSTVAHKCGR